MGGNWEPPWEAWGVPPIPNPNANNPIDDIDGFGISLSNRYRFLIMWNATHPFQRAFTMREDDRKGGFPVLDALLDRLSSQTEPYASAIKEELTRFRAALRDTAPVPDSVRLGDLVRTLSESSDELPETALWLCVERAVTLLDYEIAKIKEIKQSRELTEEERDYAVNYVLRLAYTLAAFTARRRG